MNKILTHSVVVAAATLGLLMSACGGKKKTAGPEPTHDIRVLVTGFNDWEDLGDPPNVWRCRDNPSCRLLVGAPTDTKPANVEGGPLVSTLREVRPNVHWSFETMPVTWGVAEELDIAGYDVVIHLGLGIYDRFDLLRIEHGAYNFASGTDASGTERNGKIDPKADQYLQPEMSVADTGKALDGARMGKFMLETKLARAENNFLCNETHYRSLDRVHHSGSGARVHFIHIPHAENGDYEHLSAALSMTISTLVDIASAG